MPSRVLSAPMTLTEEDILAADVNAVIAGNAEHIEDMNERLLESGERLEEAGHGAPAAVLLLLSAVATFWLNLDEPKKALQSPGQLGTMRFLGPDDLEDSHLEMLATILPHLSNDELIARVADLLWQQRKKRNIADVKASIAAYVARARALESSDHWPKPFARVKRAFQLAHAIGTSHPEATTVDAYVVDLLQRLNVSDDDSLFANALADLLLDTDRVPGDASEIAKQMERFALQSPATQQHQARFYFAAASKWYRRIGHLDDAARVDIAYGESYVTEAMTREPMVRGMLLSKAVVSLRDAKVAPERLADVRRMQATAAAQGISEMKLIEGSTIDLSGVIAHSRERAKGLSIEEGFRRLANVNAIPTIVQLRTIVQEQIAIAPLRHLFPTSTVDGAGRVLGVRGSALSKDPEAAEQAIRAEMVRHALIEQQLIVRGAVLPFVEVLSLENHIGQHEILDFVTDRPFVPRGRESVFVRGLHLGFQRDFGSAAAVLIPQVEHALRSLLALAGETPFSQSEAGVQDFWDLNRILDHPTLQTILGEDEVFDLRGLLVSRSGANFRNNVSHGLIGPSALNGDLSIYFWWRTITLIARVAFVD